MLQNLLAPLMLAAMGGLAAAPSQARPAARAKTTSEKSTRPAPAPAPLPPAAPQPPAAAPAPSVTPAAEPALRRLLLLDLKPAGVPAALAKQATVLVAENLGSGGGWVVVTQDDIARVLSVEATRTSLGCTEQASCLAELSNAAKADAVVSGSVGAVGKKLTVNLVRINPATAAAEQRVDMTVDSPRELPGSLRKLVAQLMGWSTDPGAPRFKLAAGQKLSLAVLDLGAQGVPEQVAASLTQVLSTELKRVQGTTVISRDDIQALLQVQAEKTKLGCDDTSCLAEIGGALGVEKLVVGSVGKLADSFLVSLRLISVKGVKVENRVSETFTGGEEQLIRAVRHAGRSVLGVEAGNPGTLAVSASPEGASAFVDGALRGKAPGPPITNLPPGVHTLRISRSGYLDWNGDVYVDPDEVTPVFVELKARPQAWYQKWWVWTVMAAVGSTTAAVAIATVILAGTSAAVLVRALTTPVGSGRASVN